MASAPQPAIPDFGIDLRATNKVLERSEAEARVSWAVRTFGADLALSTSFGAQSAVMLHLVTQFAPEIPVIFIDTGYLFPETYRFADELTERLQLNLKVYRNPVSPAWQEARHGKRWELGLEGIESYNKENKVEPMARALDELGIKAWMAGLRRTQSKERSKLTTIAVQEGRLKVHPILDWSDREVFEYLKKHDLPYHPLWSQGYLSIGDTHSTRPMSAGLLEEELRHNGLKRECGLHENVDTDYVI